MNKDQITKAIHDIESRRGSIRELTNAEIILELTEELSSLKAEKGASDSTIQLKPYFDDEITSCPTCGCEIPKGEKCDLDTCKKVEAEKEVRNEDIEKWANGRSFSGSANENYAATLRNGMCIGAKAMRDGLIKKGE